MRRLAHIGITGVKTLTEPHRLGEIAGDLGLQESRCLTVGGLASYNSLRLGKILDPRQYVLPYGLNQAQICNLMLTDIVHYNSRYKGLPGQIEDLLDVVESADGI